MWKEDAPDAAVQGCGSSLPSRCGRDQVASALLLVCVQGLGRVGGLHLSLVPALVAIKAVFMARNGQ